MNEFYLQIQNGDVSISPMVSVGDLSHVRSSKQRDEPIDVAGGQKDAEKPRKHLNKKFHEKAKVQS
jgi:hypothetical protein